MRVHRERPPVGRLRRRRRWVVEDRERLCCPQLSCHLPQLQLLLAYDAAPSHPRLQDQRGDLTLEDVRCLSHLRRAAVVSPRRCRLEHELPWN